MQGAGALDHARDPLVGGTLQTVAKRSVKRARQREREGGHAARPRPAAAPGRLNNRSFGLGALAAAALLIPLAIAAVVLTSGGDEDKSPARAATTQDAIQAQAAKLRRASRERDKQQVKELTERMAAMLGELGPTVRGLAKTIPPEQERIGPLASQAAVEKWRHAAAEAAKYFENPPSGETDTNVARMGFANAVDALIAAIDSYRLALADAGHRRELLEHVRAERDLAVQAWFIGGTELDAVNHKYGYGHHHLFLAPEGGGTADRQTGR
jgi:hypothetical protein